MKQLFLFSQLSEKSSTRTVTHQLTLFIDGASRNNPGLAGAGIYLLKDDKPIERYGFFLGIKTNNQAEYLALLLGLFFLQKHVHLDNKIRIVSDSELLVKQIAGVYRVKNQALKPLFTLAKSMLIPLNGSVEHVFRAENKIADKLANQGIDHKAPVPPDFIEMLRCHELSL